MRTHRQVAMLALLVAMAAPTPRDDASAQAPRPSSRPARPHGRVFAMLSVPDTFAYRGADVVILRRASTLPRDVILVRDLDVTPPLLAEAVATLQAVRARHGLVPSADQVIRVRELRARNRDVAGATEWMRHLRESPRRTVPGVGQAKSVGLRIPAR